MCKETLNTLKLEISIPMGNINHKQILDRPSSCHCMLCWLLLTPLSKGEACIMPGNRIKSAFQARIPILVVDTPNQKEQVVDMPAN